MLKKSTLLCFLLAVVSVTFAQNTYKVAWGEEMKLRKGTADLDVVYADNTGLYFTEERINSTILGGVPAVKLYKTDKNFGEVFDKDYKRELKGLSFHSFQVLGADIYLFATDYIRKSKEYKVYGAKVDKSSGDLTGDFAELGSYALENKRDDYEMKVTPIQNGSSFLMVSNISASDRVSIAVSVLDKSLKRKESTVINLSFEPKLYQLADVQFTRNNKIILLGKEFEETQIGKKKRKRLVFKEYSMAIYDADGKKEKDIVLNAANRFIISGKMIEQPDGQMMLAGFYSNQPRKEDLNGFYINKIDPVKGELLLSSFKEINAGMLGNAYEDDSDDDDDTKESKKQAKKAKDDDDEDEFPNSFIIKSVYTNPVDNSVIITSEVSKYTYYSYTSSNYNPTTRTWTHQTTHVHRFTNQDILLINADKNGNINWLNALPKSQREEIRTTRNSSSFGLSFNYDRTGYFATAGGMPFYSSFTSLLVKNNLVVIMNDHTSNNVNPQYGDRVKTVYNFRKRSNAVGVSVDLATGKMTRKVVSSNNDETVLMPRHALVVNNEVFMPSMRMKALAKTELKFARITVN
ncbi:MAG: hypothetical protein JNM88_06775 [Chitinophagaceae bacterium]|nr:hypothetical protein [Chitinophagaceae bacterium]